ncbi:unnamed protein product, partial [Iphiclides podalirius]
MGRFRGGAVRPRANSRHLTNDYGRMTLLRPIDVASSSVIWASVEQGYVKNFDVLQTLGRVSRCVSRRVARCVSRRVSRCVSLSVFPFFARSRDLGERERSVACDGRLRGSFSFCLLWHSLSAHSSIANPPLLTVYMFIHERLRVRACAYTCKAPVCALRLRKPVDGRRSEPLCLLTSRAGQFCLRADAVLDGRVERAPVL